MKKVILGIASLSLLGVIGAAVGLGGKAAFATDARTIGGDTSNYIYYVTASGEPTNDKIHAWNGSGDFDKWPGESIKDNGIEITGGVLKFEGSYKKIYKICFDEAPTGGFMLTWGDGGDSGNPEVGGKTANMTFNSGRAYWWSGDTNGIADAGLALDLLYKIENARNAASYQGHSYSICGIAPALAADLYNEYYGLSDDAKTMVENSETKTYKGKNSSGVYDWDEDDSISFADILPELKAIAVAGGQSVLGSSAITAMPVSESSSAPWLIALVSAGTALTAGGFILARKKKAE